jgi:hypothetical protein
MSWVLRRRMLEVEKRWKKGGARVGRWVVWGAMMSRASPS